MTERSPEPDDVRNARSVMERHYGQPVRPVSHYCERLAEYAEALDDAIGRGSEGPFREAGEARTVRDGLRLLRTWALKSNCLWRLIYDDEPLRTERCPEHKGRWTGCDFNGPTCGCGDTRSGKGTNVTGWLAPGRRR